MAVFAPGTNGTLKSESYEDAVAELIVKIRELEVAQGQNNVTWTLNPQTGTFNFSGSLPYSAALNEDTGKLVLDMTEYLSDAEVEPE